MRREERYSLSFTTGGLLANECRVAAGIFLRRLDWDATRAQIREDNLFGTRTAAATTRISREVIDRLQTLSDAGLALVASGDSRERAAILWSAATRRYRIIREFATEVVCDRYLSMTPTLSFEDFDRFLLMKAIWAEEVSDLAPSTVKKLRSNLFRMLREAEILSDGGAIVHTSMSGSLAAVICDGDSGGLAVFPLTDAQIAQVQA